MEVDGNVIAVSVTFLGIIGTMGVWIYLDYRKHVKEEFEEHKKKFEDHDLRLRALELMGRDVQYIKEGVDELKGRVQK